MLACARIGAPHSVVFSGFSAEALKERINDCGAKVIITADGGYRRGAVVALKQQRRQGAARPPEGEERHRRPAHRSRKSHMQAGPRLLAARGDGKGQRRSARRRRSTASTRFSSSTPAAAPASPRASCTPPAATCSALHDHEVLLRPAGGGRLLLHRRCRLDHRPQLRRLRRAGQRRAPASCTRARRTSPSRTASGASSTSTGSTSSTPRRPPSAPSSSGATTGSTPHDLSSLRLLGSVGEPINPEAWMWYHEKVGGKRCPIVDTWWQTETGAHMIAPLPGATPTKPGSATLPFFGVDAAVVDDEGKEVGPNVGGKLVIRKPVALHAAHDLRRRRALQQDLLERDTRASTSPATARAATRTATSGSWAASTTCSTSPAIASAPPRWKARSSAIPTSPKPPSSAAPTR